MNTTPARIPRRIMALSVTLFSVALAAWMAAAPATAAEVLGRNTTPNATRSEQGRVAQKTVKPLVKPLVKPSEHPDHGVLIGTSASTAPSTLTENTPETKTPTGVTCSGGRTYNGSSCVCPTGTWNGMVCYMNPAILTQTAGDDCAPAYDASAPDATDRVVVTDGTGTYVGIGTCANFVRRTNAAGEWY